VNVWHAAWEDWLLLPEEARGKMVPTTRANVVHDFAVDRAKAAFREVEGSRICEHLGFFKLYVGEDGDLQAVVRLKRLWLPDYLARNIETEQQRRYYHHRRIDGIRDGVTRLTVGYVLNTAQTEIKEVACSLQYGLEQLIYAFTLDAEPTVTQIPIAPLPPDVRPAVRAKGKAPKKAEGQ
jgi:hypothetical protein